MLSAQAACFSLPPVWVGKALKLLLCCFEGERRERELAAATANQLRTTEAAVEIFAAASSASSLKLGLPL